MPNPTVNLSSKAWKRSPPPWDVVGLGENSVDLVYRIPRFPSHDAAGSKQPISDHAVRCGGQVATAMATCAALGLRTSYIGAFGDDENGQRIREALAVRNVDLSATVTRPVPNRYAVILVDEHRGDRVVLWQRDPRLALTLDSAMLNEIVQRARWLHVDAVDEDAAKSAAQWATVAGMSVSCDIDRVTRGTRALIRNVDVPIFAEHIPEALTHERNLGRALRALQRPRHLALCVTRGRRGSLMLYKGRLYRARGFKVNAVDTTGAGDVFRGALIYAMLQGGEPAAILRFANAAAAISCTREGALDSVPSLAEVRRLLRKRSAIS